MKNCTGEGGFGGGRSKHARCGDDAHVVQQYRRLETTHTFHRNFPRKNTNSTTRLLQVNWLTDGFTSVFFVCFFFSKRCRSSAPWVRGPSSRLQAQRMVSELSGRAETLVVSAVQHTNMLVRLLKRSSHNKQTTEGENVFLMYNAGKRGAGQQVGEERRVKTSQAEFHLLIWRLSFNTQPQIALSSLNNINNKNEIWETSKENEAVYKKKQYNICTHCKGYVCRKIIK